MFWLLLVTDNLLARMDNFAKFREVLLIGFAGGCIVLYRLCLESLLEGGNRESHSAARTKEVSHTSAS
jgi:hypothetical protein